MTYGALAIPGKHQPNDFPIALNAASRAGVDYLAVGHWHNWQTYDNDRLVMPGTPEPDAFDQENSGCIALVEINGRGAAPESNGCRWQRSRGNRSIAILSRPRKPASCSNNGWTNSHHPRRRRLSASPCAAAAVTRQRYATSRIGCHSLSNHS